MMMWRVCVCADICLGEGTYYWDETLDVARVCVCGPSRTGVCMWGFKGLVGYFEYYTCE